jgi:hypothetical protein
MLNRSSRSPSISTAPTSRFDSVLIGAVRACGRITPTRHPCSRGARRRGVQPLGETDTRTVRQQETGRRPAEGYRSAPTAGVTINY